MTLHTRGADNVLVFKPSMLQLRPTGFALATSVFLSAMGAMEV